MLILFSGTAGARLITPDLRPGAHRSRRLGSRRRFAALARGFRWVRRGLIKAQLGLFRLAPLPFRLLKGIGGLELGLSQKARYVPTNAVEEPLEELEGLTFVFLLWLLLRIGAQVNALA